MDDQQLAQAILARENRHRQSMGELHALILLYRECMEAEGITPPDDTGADALARYRHVSEINAA